ncbi:MAG: competence/damage-inducible protein A [Promethearchaeia archaeon]
MIVEILVVGNEILQGHTNDTNSYWLAKRITKYGHQLRRILTIGDDVDQIEASLRYLLEKQPDVIITCGGLGPTFDDMTLKGVAKALNRELVKNKHAYAMIKKAYKQAYERGLLKLKGMTKEREKMAYLPENGKPLKNKRGTAPGVKLKEGKTFIYCLQGVPTEMKGIFNSSVKPLLKKEAGKFIEKGFTFENVGESQIAPYITELEEKHPELWIKTHPKVGLAVKVEVTVTALNVENGEELVDKVLEEIKKTVLNLDGKIKEKTDKSDYKELVNG